MARWYPYPETYWYLSEEKPLQFSGCLSTDIAIIGGGMAGLTAAQAYRARGLSVVLIERFFCGSGASGKSSGFITPDSELDLYTLIADHGKEKAHQIWDFALRGVDHIRATIETYKIDCDFSVQDSVVAANSISDFKEIKKEAKARKSCGYESTVYTADEVQKILNSPDYYGAIRYGNTFGIKAYDYCRTLTAILRADGVKIYEETPALSVGNNSITTPHGTIKADRIIVCTDRFTPELNKITSEIYSSQTHLILSEPLSDDKVRKIFPQEPVMVWDTDLIFTYYRLTGDNRLLVGGGGLCDTYRAKPLYDNKSTVKKLENYIHKKFPELTVDFVYSWPGLIGVTKDLMPLAGPDKTDASLYYIAGAAGLPWAAACGLYSARHILDGATEYDAYFSPYRSFPVGPVIQTIIGKPLAFALSHGLTLWK